MYTGTQQGIRGISRYNLDGILTRPLALIAQDILARLITGYRLAQHGPALPNYRFLKCTRLLQGYIPNIDQAQYDTESCRTALGILGQIFIRVKEAQHNTPLNVRL